ncbi:GUN4 domain-containing protein [Gloeothece verrucosa]|uniref:GUN4 domain protein n=1 Tax=Gloeothece verrucosa (strain PCC 7822) TaxID=497965 RepID=E0U6F9_GLOV7|nr:GUN4 domain-containing protein [Gloeothece verrucosa]ADN13602.1 GUN4 domain protein [Gloeothece verrucosa PCC 7822]
MNKINTNIDYGLLDKLLAAQQWEQGELETASLMLKLIDKTYWWEINSYDFQKVSPQALCKINTLWLQYSDGRFGFSVQKNIWEYLASQFNYESEKQFGELLGWRKGGYWLSGTDLIFDLSAPMGHLPGWGLLIFWLGLPVANAFLERLCNCEFSRSKFQRTSSSSFLSCS